MRVMRIPVIVSFLAFVSPGMTPALQVEINGKTLQPEFENSPCINITGEYPSFTIVPSEAGKIPQICFDNFGANHLEIHQATFVPTKNSSSIDKKGDATCTFLSPGVGDKLTLPAATGIKIDPSSQFEDHLETLESE